jgi:hypothetical protein
VLFHPNNSSCAVAATQHYAVAPAPVTTIDSADIVIFDIDMITQVGNYVEIPVFIETDDIINALDFSMTINVDNLIFDSVIDHTGELQFVAFLNPNDNKLRFTSNSFTPYPVGDQRIVSIRFQVVTSYVSRTDFEDLKGYMNGETCSAEMYGKGIVLADEEIINYKITIRPNPASEFIHIDSDTQGDVLVYDTYGHHLLTLPIQSQTTNTLDVRSLPKGNYTLQVVADKHIVKTQQILLQ